MTNPERPDDPAKLPERIPIFPLAGAILLPGGRLPLNIFEPRYLAMTRDAMRGQRMIGMIQPCNAEDESHEPQVFTTGCLGRIAEFSETGDGRYRIVLAGVCRFRVREHLNRDTSYRQVLADYQPYADDLAAATGPQGIDREDLLAALKTYLTGRGFKADWAEVTRASDTVLVNSLAMVLPLAASEKQALLEAELVSGRARVMTALLRMAALERDDDEAPVH